MNLKYWGIGAVIAIVGIIGLFKMMNSNPCNYQGAIGSTHEAFMCEMDRKTGEILRSN